MKNSNNSNNSSNTNNFSEELKKIQDSIQEHEQEIETHIEQIKKLRSQQKRYEKCIRLLSENDDDERPTRSRSASNNDPKRMSLPSLLEMIGQQQSKGIKYKDMAVLVKNSGYRTHSKNFSNMVYQALEKLVHKGKFQKDRETLEYTYAG